MDRGTQRSRGRRDGAGELCSAPNPRDLHFLPIKVNAGGGAGAHRTELGGTARVGDREQSLSRAARGDKGLKVTRQAGLRVALT